MALKLCVGAPMISFVFLDFVQMCLFNPLSSVYTFTSFRVFQSSVKSVCLALVSVVIRPLVIHGGLLLGPLWIPKFLIQNGVVSNVTYTHLPECFILSLDDLYCIIQYKCHGNGYLLYQLGNAGKKNVPLYLVPTQLKYVFVIDV